MTDKTEKLSQDLESLAHHLEAHGPDLSRWPLQSQQKFAGLLASNGAAQQLMREAKALDRLVERGLMASPPAGQSSQPQYDRLARLRATVLQAAASEGAPRVVLPAAMEISQTADGAELEWPAARTAEQALAAPSGPPETTAQVERLRLRSQPRAFFGWPATAAMAASLALGVFAGARSGDDPLFAPQSPSELGSMADDDELADAELAFGAGFGDVDEEDTL